MSNLLCLNRFHSFCTLGFLWVLVGPSPFWGVSSWVALCCGFMSHFMSCGDGTFALMALPLTSRIIVLYTSTHIMTYTCINVSIEFEGWWAVSCKSRSHISLIWNISTLPPQKKKKLLAFSFANVKWPDWVQGRLNIPLTIFHTKNFL